MKRVFLIHGWEGKPDNHWFPWLALELKADFSAHGGPASGWEVNAPQMPNAAEPKVSEWLSFLKDYVGRPDEETFFVGHSLGCITVARYLAKLSSDSPLIKGALPSSAGGISKSSVSKTRPPSFSSRGGSAFGGRKGRIEIGGCVFVAGFSGCINVSEIKEFYELPFDPEKAKMHCDNFVMIFSDNDPYVPMEKSLEMARELGAKTILERGKGHFTKGDGVTALPSALSALLKMAAK